MTTWIRTRIAIGGASAGGGLAAALALLARERGVVTPRLQLLSYPMLDDRTVLRTDLDERLLPALEQRGEPVRLDLVSRTANLAPQTSARLAAPAREEDLSGLPPAWIGVGTLDLFFDEDMAYAKRLRTAGVPCELHVVEGAFHGFDSVAPKASITRAYRVEQVQALASALARRRLSLETRAPTHASASPRVDRQPFRTQTPDNSGRAPSERREPKCYGARADQISTHRGGRTEA